MIQLPLRAQFHSYLHPGRHQTSPSDMPEFTSRWWAPFFHPTLPNHRARCPFSCHLRAILDTSEASLKLIDIDAVSIGIGKAQGDRQDFYPPRWEGGFHVNCHLQVKPITESRVRSIGLQNLKGVDDKQEYKLIVSAGDRLLPTRHDVVWGF